MKLARQFDQNMQDRESSEGGPDTGRAQLRSADQMKDLQGSSSADRVEAELQALFDCSTQKVSGRLSQGSSASSCSQEVKAQPAAALLERSRQTRLASERPVPAALGSNNDFDDDWENDELLDDPLLLEMTHNPPQPHDRPRTTSQTHAEGETGRSCSGFQPAKAACARQPSAARSTPTHSTLQELCPTLKTTKRSTFKLEPNLHFQAKDLSRPALSPLQPQYRSSPLSSTAAKTVCQCAEAADWHTGAPGCSQAVSDSLWDDGDDDSLLYQVCDSVERISDTPSDQVSSSCKNQRAGGERAQTCTTAVPIGAGGGCRALRQSPRTFVRSNSLPATSSGAGNYKGWDFPMRGANNKPQTSQSLPGSHMVLGNFSQARNWSGKSQTGNDGAPQACTLTTRTSHTAFKRNFSDSAVPINKGAAPEIEHFKGIFILYELCQSKTLQTDVPRCSSSHGCSILMLETICWDETCPCQRLS